MVKKKNKGGRPPKYSTPKALQKRIDSYFKNGMAKRIVWVGPAEKKIKVLLPTPTISGLALYCGFCDRHSFYAYEVIPKFSNTIKKARARMEQHYEQLLQGGLGAGAIFALKNFGWVDRLDFGTPPAVINVFIQNILTKAGLNGQPERETAPSNSESKARFN